MTMFKGNYCSRKMDFRGSALLFLSLVAMVSSQTIMKASQDVESFHVTSDIRYRFATTQMVSVVRNRELESREISFDVTLPKEAFIMHFNMVIDGKVYEGEVKEKMAAKQQYQEAVNRGQSAGHVAQKTRHANLFDMSVNVASGSVVNFTLVYQELLRRKLGLYQHEIHVRPGQPVEDFQVKVFIKDKVPITKILTPTVKRDYLISNEAGETPEYMTIVQRSPDTAYIEYLPTMKEQGENGMDARFLLQYDVDHSTKGEVLAVDGYFVHFYVPELPPMPKDIIFVLDKSGSMTGKKIHQLKTAMKSILKDLMPEDRFNIINFSDNAFQWKRELIQVNNDVTTEASRYVDAIGANGGTNINSALVQAVRDLQHNNITARAPLIFFLTDGQATSGVTRGDKIKSNILSTNEGIVSIFSLAFGDDADYNLLKEISAQNSGFARKIYEASDSALQVSFLYQEISAVVAKDLKVQYLNSSVDEFTLTRTDFPVVFNGSEVVICGRLDNLTTRLEMEVTAVKKGGDLRFTSWVDDLEAIILPDPTDRQLPLFHAPRDFAGIVERMWAFLSIKQMLKEKDTFAGDEAKTKELKNKIIDMAVKYKFVTPLTSMVVTKPDKNGEPTEKLESGLTDVDDVSKDTPSLLSSGGSSGRVQHRFSASGIQHKPMRRQRKQGSIQASYGRPGHPSLGLSGARNARGQLFDWTRASMIGHDDDLAYTFTPRPQLTTTPRPNAGRRGPKPSGGRGKGGGRRKGSSRSKPTKVVLSVITMDDGSKSYCVVPKRWVAGNYSLLAKPKKGKENVTYPMILEVTSISKRTLGFKALYFRDGTWLKADKLTSQGWNFKKGTDTDVATRSDNSAIAMERRTGMMFAAQVVRRTRWAWHIEILIRGDGEANFLKTFRQRSNKRNRKTCERTGNSYDVIGIVAGRKARKYMLNTN